MKYIRRYNESNSEGLNEEQIKDFCETHLAYLMDEGLRILVSSQGKVTLSLRLVHNKTWLDIKDHIIPFLIHLKNDYELMNIGKDDRFGSYNMEFNIVPGAGSAYGSYPEWFHIDNVISEKIDKHRLNDDSRILTIQFQIEDSTKYDLISQITNEGFEANSYEKRMELQEFANDYLAYLIDDEWSVSVWGFTTSYKIVLLSPRSVKRNRVHHDDVTWLSVKNRIIPFVQMLATRYHLGYEGSSTIIRIEASYSDDIHIKNAEQLEDLSDDMLFYSFSIVVKK